MTTGHNGLEDPDPADASDTESFYSATSTVKRRRKITGRHRRHSDALITGSKETGLPPHTERLATRTYSPCSSRPSSRSNTMPRPNIPSRSSSMTGHRRVNRPNLASIHWQSCQLFSSLDTMVASSRAFQPLPTSSNSRPSTRHASISSSTPSSQSSSFPSPVFENPGLRTQSTISSFSSFNSPATSPRPSTQLHSRYNSVISWTSDATRRAEYQKIDKAYSGVRGFMKKVLPERCQNRSRRNFYCHECDSGSVRRFRISLSDDDDDSRSTYSFHANGRDMLSEKQNETRIESVERRKMKKKPSWMCFAGWWSWWRLTRFAN